MAGSGGWARLRDIPAVPPVASPLLGAPMSSENDETLADSLLAEMPRNGSTKTQTGFLGQILTMSLFALNAGSGQRLL